MKDEKENKVFFKVLRDKEEHLDLPKNKTPHKAHHLEDNKIFSYNDRMLIRKFSFVMLIDFIHKMAEDYLQKTDKTAYLNPTTEDFTDYTFVDIKKYLNKPLRDIFIMSPVSNDDIEKVYHNLFTINTSTNTEFKSLMFMKVKDMHNLFIKSEQISHLINDKDIKIGSLLEEQFQEISKNLIRYYDP